MTRPLPSPPPIAARRLLVIGAVAALAGLAISGRPYVTLYDGVVPVEPYRYLTPGPGQPGDPPSATATVKVVGGASDLVAVATGESVPQAQAFVIPGGLALPAGTTAIDVSITAVEPPAAQPTDGHLAGNVYAFNVTNQASVPISAKPEAQASIELRAPDQSTTTATIERFDGSAWQPLATTPAGVAALFTAVVTQFGEFAVVLPGVVETAAPSGPATVGPSGPPASESSAPEASQATGSGSGLSRETLTFVLGGAALVVVVLVAALALLPSRRGPPARGGSGGARGGSGAARGGGGPSRRRR